MKKACTFLFFGFFILAASGQAADTTKYARSRLINGRVEDSIEAYRARHLQIISSQRDSMIYSEPAFASYMEKAFTQVNFNRLNVAEGNSASVEFKDGDTKMNLSIAGRKKLWTYTLGTTVSVSDKSGTLFSKEKPTSGTGFNFGLSRLLQSKSNLEFDDDVQSLIPLFRKMALDSVSNNFGIGDSIKLEELIVEYEKTENEINTKNQQIQKLVSEHSKNKGKDTLIIKANNELIELISKREKCYKQLKPLLATTSWKVYDKRFKKSALAADIASMINAGGIYQYRLNWLSFQGGYKRNTYATYNDDLKFDERIGKKNADIWNGQVSYNFYWQETPYQIERAGRSFFSSRFLSMVYGISTGNSYDLLDQTTLNIIKETRQSDTVYQFVTSGKYRDITKVNFTKNVVHKPGVQFSSSFGEKQFMGMNILLGGEFAGTNQPVYNFRGGLLFHFNDSEDEKSKVNFEIFLAFGDMADTRKIGGSVWKRREIGITTTVPFSKIFFN
jgi:hypothetical protein